MSDNFDIIVMAGTGGGGCRPGFSLARWPSWARTGRVLLNRPACPQAICGDVGPGKDNSTAGKMGFSKAEAAVDPAAVFKMKDELGTSR
jgi:hypothetical protein